MVKFVKIPLQFFVLLQFVDGFTYQAIVRDVEICGTFNGHRKYLELGDSGEITADNILVPKYYQEMSKIMNISTIHQCSIEFVTCPSCLIRLEFEEISFLSNCQSAQTGACRCDHLILSEPPYDNEKNLQYNCGVKNHYQTTTRSLQMKFLYWNNYTSAFRARYQAIESHQIITPLSIGNSDDDTVEGILNNKQTTVLASPFFPSPYPRDYITEYSLQCASPSKLVHIIFSDFQLARSSSMDFINSNGEKYFTTGATFRPPILISSGSSMTIRFNANGGEGVYKAKVSCVTEEESLDDNMRPHTQECGGLVTSLGGFITMINILKSDDNPILYDCIWLIKPTQRYDISKTHISIKVDTFESMASDSEITIHQGLTSDSPVMQVVRSSPDENVNSDSLVVSISSGLYVRFKGKIDNKSRMAIVFTSFSYSKCYAGSEFECRNHRCIPLNLQCDGYDHCDDGSDEHGLCTEMWEHGLINRKWPISKYFFPKTDIYPDVKTTTFALLLSSATFLFVITCLLASMYRNSNRAREQEEFQNHLQTISQLLEANTLAAAQQQQEELANEPPPLYEAPPNYDEIINIGMDDQISRMKKERRPSTGRKSRMRTPRRSDPSVSAFLQVQDDNSDIPSTSSIGSESPYLNNHNHSDNFLSSMQMLDIEEASETSPGRSPELPQFYESCEDGIERKIIKSCSEPLNTSLNQYTYSPISAVNDSTPKHLWSNESKYKKTWIRFTVDEPSTSRLRREMQTSFDSVSDAQMQDIDNYLKQYEKPLLSPECCDKFKASLLSEKTECNRCKNLIYQRENRRCSMCGDCVEMLYSPKICEICHGRISFQDLMNANIKHAITNTDRSRNPRMIKLCNCFPKYPSQNFSTSELGGESQVLPIIHGKSCSYNEIVHQPKVVKDKKSNQYFSSHTCLPLRSNSSSYDSDDDDDEYVKHYL